MDPLGIIGSGQGYGAQQQRQVSGASASGQPQPTAAAVNDPAIAKPPQSSAEPQGITLPEDTVTLSGQRPQQKDTTKPGEKPGTDATTTADKKAASADKSTASGKSAEDPQVKQQVDRLKAIEEKVKAHEAAHKSAGGGLAGAVSYSYTQGPDGRSYVTGGEVQINMSGGRTPQETISRMQQVIQAALAPADPSGQDRAVASQAASQMAQAQQEKLQTNTSTAEPKPGQQVDPVEEAARKALQPKQEQQSVSEAATATDTTAGRPETQQRASGATPTQGADRTAVGRGVTATADTTPQTGGSDLTTQVQRAYTDPAVQAAGARPAGASSGDAASVLGIFTVQPRTVSSYA